MSDVGKIEKGASGIALAIECAGIFVIVELGCVCRLVDGAACAGVGRGSAVPNVDGVGAAQPGFAYEQGLIVLITLNDIESYYRERGCSCEASYMPVLGRTGEHQARCALSHSRVIWSGKHD